jgi:aminoglycoside phosphotransferase (APT) family kinase protein
MSVNARSAVHGLDVPRVTSWLAEHVPGLQPPLEFVRIGEGQSNLTFRIQDVAGRSLVLRRPPLGELLASAHDVAREYRILTGLASAAARVPRPIALCEDLGVTGAPFYAMEHVDGLILVHRETAERLPPWARAAAGNGLATTLAELHSLDLDALGLGDFRRPESLISRQLRRWYRQWEGSKTRDLPLVDELAAQFQARMPVERETVLVHGDYHLGNALAGEDGSLLAVLDWELCSVGDPMADVGLMVAYWGEFGSAAGTPEGLFREPVTVLPGFPTAAEVAGAYALASGRELADLGFWVAFAYWKIAIIVEGVYRRWLNDPANGSGAGSLQPAVTRLVGLAGDALHGRQQTPVN